MGTRATLAKATQKLTMRILSRADHTPGRAALRLREILVELERTSERISVTELSRRANVSCNSLYRYHGEILQRLRRIPKKMRESADANQNAILKLRRENIGLRKELAQVAALVDHFYAAYQECQALLGRRDRELVELRRRLGAKPQLVR